MHFLQHLIGSSWVFWFCFSDGDVFSFLVDLSYDFVVILISFCMTVRFNAFHILIGHFV